MERWRRRERTPPQRVGLFRPASLAVDATRKTVAKVSCECADCAPILPPLDPPVAAVEPPLPNGRDGDESPRPAVAPAPPQLGDVDEVLARQADDERRHEQKRWELRQPLPDLVLDGR